MEGDVCMHHNERNATKEVQFRQANDEHELAFQEHSRILIQTQTVHSTQRQARARCFLRIVIFYWLV